MNMTSDCFTCPRCGCGLDIEPTGYYQSSQGDGRLYTCWCDRCGLEGAQGKGIEAAYAAFIEAYDSGSDPEPPSPSPEPTQ